MSPRYAIYFVPPAESALYRFGAGLLGYDGYTGADVAPSGEAGLPTDWAALTTAPRRYGFHATLKAPFHLADASAESALIDAVTAFGRAPREPIAVAPAVRALGDFIAIVPREPVPALDRLAADCVTCFDRFRAPPSAQDRARRLTPGLSARERAHVERWGYPYVFDDFRFHMTLTGRVPPERQAEVLATLRRSFSAHHADGAIAIDRLGLFKQDDPRARFRVLFHVPLSEAR